MNTCPVPVTIVSVSSDNLINISLEKNDISFQSVAATSDMFHDVTTITETIYKNDCKNCEYKPIPDLDTLVNIDIKVDSENLIFFYSPDTILSYKSTNENLSFSNIERI